jgi:hypothetical protein
VCDENYSDCKIFCGNLNSHLHTYSNALSLAAGAFMAFSLDRSTVLISFYTYYTAKYKLLLFFNVIIIVEMHNG